MAENEFRSPPRTVELRFLRRLGQDRCAENGRALIVAMHIAQASTPARQEDPVPPGWAAKIALTLAVNPGMMADVEAALVRLGHRVGPEDEL